MSAPVPTRALPLVGDEGLARATAAMTAIGAPLPPTVLALRDRRLAVPAGTLVLSVENPRLLEAVAGGVRPHR